MSLTPCRFWAQGNCRYGNSCRFFHEQRGQQQTSGFFGNRTLAPATFQPNAGGFGQQALNLTNKSNQNLDIIIEGVKKDMQEWQACKIWPYSCYGPVGGKSCVPGFEDVSPDEYRLAFMQQGNVVPPELNQRFQQIQQLRLNYQQSTMENRTMIERIVTINPGTGSQSAFGGGSVNQQANNIFGGTSTGTASQPQGQQSTSIFGGGSSFGASATANVFGGGQTSLFQSQPTQQQQTSIFGTQGQAGFGTASQPQQTASVFQNPQQSQTGIFQSQPPSVTGTFFQQPNSTAATGGIFSQQQQQPSLLSNTNQTQPNSNFFQQQQPQLQTSVQQQPPSGLFQVSQPQQQSQSNSSIFSQPQTSLFAPQAASGSIFGGGNQPQPILSAPNAPANQSILGGSTPTGVQPSTFGGSTSVQSPVVHQVIGATAVQKFIYSDESDLSPQELQAFKDNDFSLESLPTKVPPQSLCL